MNTNPIKTALCSFGMSGEVFHGPSLKVLPEFDLRLILERNRSNSSLRYPEAKIVQTYEEILNDKEIELIIVNTPDEFHYGMALEAIRSGKHVVVEKPFTKYPHEAEHLLAEASRMGVKLTVYQNRRLDGGFLTLQKVLKDNLLGRVVSYECHYDRYRNFIQHSSWKEKGDERTGVLFNLGSHMVDQALVLFGIPHAVTAHLSVLRTGGITTDCVDIRLHYTGMDALLRSSYLVREPGPQLIVHGTEGSFIKKGSDPQEEQLKRHILPDNPVFGVDPPENRAWINTSINGLHFEGHLETINGNYASFYQTLYKSIRRDEPLPVRPEEALQTIRILDCCLKSHNEKATIQFTA